MIKKPFLDTFLTKYKITLSSEALYLSRMAIGIMEKSVDVLHDETHVYRMLENLGNFITHSKEIDRKDINFNVLVPAICWHDTWKSSRFAKNLVHLLYHLYMDGLGSSRLFNKITKEENISPDIRNHIAYAVRKHSSFQMRPVKTLEAKLLRDMDKLDEWTIERLKALEKTYLNGKDVNHKLLKLGVFYFKKKMMKMEETRFTHQWPREEFRRRKRMYVEYINAFIDANYQMYSHLKIDIEGLFPKEEKKSLKKETNAAVNINEEKVILKT